MATQGYTDYGPISPKDGGVAGDFIATQKQRTGFGVQNIKTEDEQSGVYTKADRASMAVAEERRQRGRYLKRVVDPNTIGGRKLEKYGNRLQQLGTLQKLNARGRAGHGVNRVAKMNAKIIYSWTGFLYFSFQIFLAILALVSLGAATVADSDGFFGWVTDAVTGILTGIAYLMGFDLPSWQVLFFIPTIAIIFVAFISYAFGALQFKLGGAHPFFGNSGASFKQGAVLLGFVLYVIPGFNFFPWVWVWVWVVSHYPN